MRLLLGDRGRGSCRGGGGGGGGGDGGSGGGRGGTHRPPHPRRSSDDVTACICIVGREVFSSYRPRSYRQMSGDPNYNSRQVSGPLLAG